MSEVNARYERDMKQAATAAILFGAIAAALWLASYFASFPAAKDGQGQWFAAVSVVALIAAIGCTAGSVFATAWRLLDQPPMPGGNY